MRYTAPWDRSLRISTGVLVAVLALAAATVAGISAAVGGGPVVGALSAFAVAVIGAIALLAWALAPTGFAVEGRTVRVERRLWPVTIPLDRLEAIGPLVELRSRGGVRLGGTSGFFGHYGRFWSRSLGAFRLYATRTRDLVLLDLPEERFVLSPGAPERFLEEVRALAPGAAVVDDPEALGRRPMPRRAKIELAAALASVPLLVAAVFLGTAAFAPVGASVGSSAVRIERRWATADEIPLARVRGVEVLGAAGGFRRIAGVHGPGISYGRFRSEALGDFQLYDWGAGPYVLLETEDGPVVLTPDDPDRFVAQVRAARPRP